jgi:acyl carrier protein
MNSSPSLSAGSTSVLDVVLAAYRDILDNPGVTSHDDFFDVGGDSMQALDVIEIIEKELDINIGVATFFTCPTAGDLARAITESAELES